MSVDTPYCRFHNRIEAKILLSARRKSLEHSLEEAVSRALRDNLTPLQRTADELQTAYADLVSACASSQPTNALPALLRAQTAASALAAGLSVLSNFVAVTLNPRDRHYSRQDDFADESASVAVEEPQPSAPARQTPPVAHREPDEWVEEPEESFGTKPRYEIPVESEAETTAIDSRPAAVEEIDLPVESEVSQPEAEEPVLASVPAFDVASLPGDMQDLHRRANRVAKVAMQDIKLLHPNEVRAAREQRNICGKMRSDLDKARKEYDRRFRAIHEHPVDYFHHWMVKILADGDAEALGEYPYPSPVLRH
jgi:hypothetical protein